MTKDEQDLPILTLRQFVKDTGLFSGEAEIAVNIIGLPVTIPILSVGKLECENDKKYILLAISRDSIMAAIDHCNQMHPGGGANEAH